MSITPAMVKELRERTGAGMMDCKKALDEMGGNVDNAIDWLRKKGLAAAAKKAGRAAAEGLIGVYVSDLQGAIVEVNAETDFVGRNETFQDYVRTVTSISISTDGNLEQLKSAGYPGTGKTVEEQLNHLIAVIGENMNLRRSATLKVKSGVVTSYIHSSIAPNLGRIGVLVALESMGDKDKLNDLSKQIAMHIAANNPQVLSLEEITEDQKVREYGVLKDQVRANLEKIEQFIISNIVPQTPGILTLKEVDKTQFDRQSKALAKLIRKELENKDSISIKRIQELSLTDEVISQTVEANLEKFINDSALNEQAFVMNNKKKVSEVVEDYANKIGSPIKVVGFIRYELGEGIEKKEENFAEEVAAQLR